MKFRFTLAILGLVAGLAFGFSALPGQAHAAAPVALSATDRSNLQAVLDLTKATLDAIQVQVDHNAVQDRAATLATLGNIRSYLLNMNQLLGGTPVTLIEEPAPGAQAPRSVAVAAQAPETPATVENSPTTVLGEAATPAQITPTVPQDNQIASVGSTATSRWVFWIILVAAVLIGIVLALPKKKVLTFEEATAGPAPKKPESPGDIQSA